MIKVLIGVSGIGKSTVARKLVESDRNAIVVSRDKLRELLFSYSEDCISEYYKTSNFQACEKIVTENLEKLVHNHLIKGKNVILDSTHLKIKYINAIKKKFYYTDIEFIDVAKQQNISLDHLELICVTRDSNRIRKVGASIISQQILQYKQLLNDFDFSPYKYSIQPIEQDNTLCKAVIFDIDGTLALKGDRSPYDWNRVDKDDLNEWVSKIARIYYEWDYSKYKVIICTGRDGVCENLTKEWLYYYDVPYDEFHIRPGGNMEPDYIIKERMWRDIASRYYIECLYDDRNQVVDHARRLGLNVAQVNYGDF